VLPLILERIEKRSVLHFLENLHRNPAGNVNSVEGHHLQRKVTRLRSIHGGPQIERIHANGAALIQPALGDERRGVRVRIIKYRMPHIWRDEFVQCAEAPPRKYQLPADLRIAAQHEPQQVSLTLSM